MNVSYIAPNLDESRTLELEIENKAKHADEQSHFMATFAVFKERNWAQRPISLSYIPEMGITRLLLENDLVIDFDLTAEEWTRDQ